MIVSLIVLGLLVVLTRGEGMGCLHHVFKFLFIWNIIALVILTFFSMIGIGIV